MKDIIPAKKESPILGLAGLGGGVGSNVVAGGSEKSYIDEIFSPAVYTGNATAGRQINNGIDLSGKGGMTWIKRRTGTSGGNHCIFDTERGASKLLMLNSSGVESTSAARMSAFNSNGFTVGSDNGTNKNDENFASWSFREQKGFFDIVKYDGDSNTNRIINHDLGTRPGMIWVKRYSGGNEQWEVWHRNLNDALLQNIVDSSYLEITNAGLAYNNNRWGTSGQQATDTTFSVGNHATVNETGSSYVAYIFAHNTSCKNNVPTAYVKAAGDPMPLGSGTLTMANGPFSDNANGSVHFDGTTMLQIPSASRVDRLKNNKFCVECWFRLDANALAAENVIFCKWGDYINGSSFGTNGAKYSYQFSVESNGRAVWRIGSTSGFQTQYGNTTIAEETWYHVAMVNDNDTLIMYINGQMQSSSPSVSHRGNSGDTWPHIIGGYWNNGGTSNFGIAYPFKGRVSNFRYNNTEQVYNTNFTPATENLTLTSQGSSADKVNILCCNGVNRWGDETKGNIHGDSGEEEVIKCGTWDGRGTRINLGWTPQLIIWKASTDGPGSHGRWFVNDTRRGIFDNEGDRTFFMDNDDIEFGNNNFYPLPNGFEIHSGGDYTGNAVQNGPYIYMAIRDRDVLTSKPVESGSDVFWMANGMNGATLQTLPSFKTASNGTPEPMDIHWYRDTSTSDAWKGGSRQEGVKYMQLGTTASEQTSSALYFDFDNGYNNSVGNWSSYQAWMWRKYAGLDLIPYCGQGSDNRSLLHNLGQAPEMIWLKNMTSSGYPVCVYHKDLTSGYHLYLDTSGGETTANTPNITQVNSKYFRMGSYQGINGDNHRYLAWLFSSVSGISKTDTYTGNGQTLSNGKYINTGFQPRLIIIKRKDSTGNWYTFDSLRGFGTPGQNTTNLYLNGSSTENGSTLVEPDATGFRVVDDSPQVNGNNNTYIYYAHA